MWGVWFAEQSLEGLSQGWWVLGWVAPEELRYPSALPPAITYGVTAVVIQALGKAVWDLRIKSTVWKRNCSWLFFIGFLSPFPIQISSSWVFFTLLEYSNMLQALILVQMFCFSQSPKHLCVVVKSRNVFLKACFIGVESLQQSSTEWKMQSHSPAARADWFLTNSLFNFFRSVLF